MGKWSRNLEHVVLDVYELLVLEDQLVLCLFEVGGRLLQVGLDPLQLLLPLPHRPLQALNLRPRRTQLTASTHGKSFIYVLSWVYVQLYNSVNWQLDRWNSHFVFRIFASLLLNALSLFIHILNLWEQCQGINWAEKHIWHNRKKLGLRSRQLDFQEAFKWRKTMVFTDNASHVQLSLYSYR